MALGVLGLIGAIPSSRHLRHGSVFGTQRAAEELGIRVASGARRREVLATALGARFAFCGP